MHRDRVRKMLQQDRIEDMTTDRTLVLLLRKQYMRHRGRILHMASLKGIRGVLFVRFRLPIAGSVDVRHHDPCCTAVSVGALTCECIPPSTKSRAFTRRRISLYSWPTGDISANSTRVSVKFDHLPYRCA